MRDDIGNLITMLTDDIDAAAAKAKTAVSSLSTAMAGASARGDTAQTALFDAIKAQIGVAVAEVERFDGAIGGQIKTADMYAQSLAK